MLYERDRRATGKDEGKHWNGEDGEVASV
jgi:hypothetical protein